MVEREREGDDGAHHQQQGNDATDREGQRDRVQPDEAALFTLLIGDVEGIEDGFDAGIGAPDREHEAKQEGDTKRRTAVRHDARHLVLDDLERTLGQHHRERLQVGTDCRGIGEQAIE